MDKATQDDRRGATRICFPQPELVQQLCWAARSLQASCPERSCQNPVRPQLRCASVHMMSQGIHIKDADVDNEMVGAVESLIGQDGSSYISRGKISMATLRPELQNDNMSVEKAPRATRLCASPQCQREASCSIPRQLEDATFGEPLSGGDEIQKSVAAFQPCQLRSQCVRTWPKS
jgi:hypothetical protein